MEERIPPSHSLDKPLGKPLEKEPNAKKVANGNKVIAKLNSVSFTGNTILVESVLQNTIAQYINTSLTKS